MALKTKAAPTSEFPGFTEEAFKFLKGLKKNNDREWFLPRKRIFETQLQEPMTALMLGVEAELRRNQVLLLTKNKAILNRIYRDVRFSANKDPYHTHIGGMLHKNGRKDAPGGLYVHIGDKEKFAAVGFWQPDRPLLTNWRVRMQEDPKAFLKMVQQLKSKDLVMDDKHRLQRMPRGFEAEEGSGIAEYLRYQSFVIIRPLDKGEVMSPKLPSIITKFGLDAKPLLEFGWAVPGARRTVFMD